METLRSHLAPPPRPPGLLIAPVISPEMKETTNPKRILHIDGDWNDRDEVRMLVEKACPGCELTVTDSGAEGIELIQANKFDLVILCPWSREVNGFRVCDWIRERGLQMPVYFLAHHETLNDRRFAEASCATGFYTVDEAESLFCEIERVLKDPEVC